MRGADGRDVYSWTISENEQERLSALFGLDFYDTGVEATLVNAPPRVCALRPFSSRPAREAGKPPRRGEGGFSFFSFFLCADDHGGGCWTARPSAAGRERGARDAGRWEGPRPRHSAPRLRAALWSIMTGAGLW